MRNNRKFRLSLLLGLLIFALVLSACGAGAAATDEPVGDTTQEAGATATEEAGDTATQEPAPEATLAELGGGAGSTRWGYGCLGTAEDAIKDLDCREVTIAIENAYLPFNYVDLDTGMADGWDYHTWREICVRLHCSPVFVETGWEGMIQAVSDGQFDAAADGITITEDRKELVDFSNGYINIEQRILVRKDEERFSSMDEIVADEALVVGTQTGTTNYETALKFLPEARVKAFETFPFAVQALLSGDVDAVLIDETAGQGYVGESADQLKLVGESLSSDQLGFIFPKGSDLVDPVNQALIAMKEDGTLEEISALFFGANFSITYDDIGEGAYATEEPTATAEP
jgi:polar amino acid transport system substrate-binding protein